VHGITEQLAALGHNLAWEPLSFLPAPQSDSGWLLAIKDGWAKQA